MFSLHCYVVLLRMWRRRCFHGINSMVLMPQIFDVIANENVRYKCNELEFRIFNFSWIILGSLLEGLKYKEWMSFSWVHGGMNRSAEHTNCPRTLSRLMRFVYPALQFIPPWTKKKRHSFLKNTCFTCLR